MDEHSNNLKNSYPGRTVDEMPLIKRYYSFQLIHIPRSTKIISRILTGLFLAFILILFLPWQQSVRAKGKVTALKPGERPQNVNSNIEGFISEWFIQEGQYVHQGDTLIRLTELKEKYFDPNTGLRLDEQTSAKEQGVLSIEQKAQALKEQIVSIENEFSLSLQKVKNKVFQSRYKFIADSAGKVASKVDYEIALEQYKRYEALVLKGLISQTQLESRKQKFQETQAKLSAAENKYLVSQNELLNASIEVNSISAEYTSKLAKCRADLDETNYKINDAKAAYSKAQNESANFEKRSSYYYVLAPQTGLIVKSLKSGIGETVKQGEPLITIMPEKHSLAVEIFVNPNDVPLLSRGRKVRIEFDGWPALQFSGWPSVSVGTFGGEIWAIDFVAGKDGLYRVLVIPDKAQEAWPQQLRMGSPVLGWAMLDNVRIWYEIWRQLNGFPPSLKVSPPDEFKEPKKEKAAKEEDE